MISGFNGPNRFLSNFYPSNVEFEGLTYPTVEHAYQAAKTLEPRERQIILSHSGPDGAKSAGRRVTMRPDWDAVKLSIMKRLLQKKFYDTTLKTMLLETGEEQLEEANYWHDNYWGRCTCLKCKETTLGLNYLGLLLMEVRQEIRT